MKKVVKTIAAVTVVFTLLSVAPVNKARAQLSISIQTFYSDLSPYGQWVDDPDYGYVWVPEVGADFRPYYSRGHWVMTDYGMMWVSSYSWGWAPFHYGRWVYSSYYGWIWIPDTTWGPAWVVWRWGGDYCGWAPLGPRVSVSFSFGSGFSVPNDWWVFIPQRYCLSGSFYNYRIAPAQNVAYVRNTTIINNTYAANNVTYVAGPRLNDVQRVTGGKVPVHRVTEVSQPSKTSVAGNSVKTYRPQVTKKESVRPPAAVTRNEFMRTKGQGHGQQIRQPAQQAESKAVQQDNRRAVEERRQQITRQPQQIEKYPVEPNKNKRVIEEHHQQISQPSQQMEKRQMQQQNNKQMMQQEGHQQASQPPPQMDKGQVQQQNNKQMMQQEHRQQISKPPQQQKQQSPNPGNKGKGNGKY